MALVPAIVLGGAMTVMALWPSLSQKNSTKGEFPRESFSREDVIIGKAQLPPSNNNNGYDNYYDYSPEEYKSIKHPTFKNHHYALLEPAPTKEKYVDKSREYKDLCTDIVTKHFFASDQCLFNFLNLICTLYYDALESYRKEHNMNEYDLFFIYKGGNILRIISNDFIKELPYVASVILKSNYEKYFGRSDCDFAIYIRDTVPDYLKVYNEVTLISYLLQIKIKKILLNDPVKYFDFYKYTREYQEKILESYKTAINNSESIKDQLNDIYFGKNCTGLAFVNSSKYVGRPDICIQSTQGTQGTQSTQSKLALFQLTDEVSPLYVSVNETLDFVGQEPWSRGKFNLVRTKVAFNIYFNNELYNIGGELIDVSISHKFDYKLVELYSHKDVAECISKYTLTYKDSSLSFLGYSLDYLTHDLELILFVEYFPWNDRKYVKRVNRLFYLYFVNCMTSVKDNNKRMKIVDKIMDAFSINVNDLDDTIKIADKFDEILEFINDDKVTFTHLLKFTAKIMTEIKSDDINHLNDFNKVIVKNCFITREIYSKIKHYCKYQGRVAEQSLYTNDFSSLIGGFACKRP